MDRLHRLLFEQLGRGLDATFPASALADVPEDSMARARRQGWLRELPIGPVRCPVTSCNEDCELDPATVAAARRGTESTYRLVCPHGWARERLVADREIMAYQLGAQKLVETLCRSNDVPCCFNANQPGSARVFPLGSLPWRNDALLCVAVGLQRTQIEARLAAAAVIGPGPTVVLLPPPLSLATVDRNRLARAGVHPFEMDHVVDWSLLEIRRHHVLEDLAAANGRSTPSDADAQGLVLYQRRQEAFFLGHKLDLSPLPFGFLLALAGSVGRVVRKDDVAMIAYGALAENRGRNGTAFDPVENADPGQLPKIKNRVMAAFDALVSSGQVARERIVDLIKNKRGVGYQLDCAHVAIRD